MGHLIEIAKPGRYKAINGREYEFSEQDLRDMASGYDPKLHEAPLCVGHPKLDAPAFGWTKGLKVIDGRLAAFADDLIDGFSEAIQGPFKKRSPAFYPPNHPNNPTPGKWYLRHIGFLGATAPAIKGLADVQMGAAFADGAAGDDDDLAAIEFGDWNDRTVARAFRSLREFLIAEFGSEKADLALPGWSVDSIQEEAAQPETDGSAFAEGTDTEPPDSVGDDETPTRVDNPKATPPAAEPTPAGSSTGVKGEKPPELSEKEKELAERELKLKEREDALARQTSASRTQELTAFCEGIISSGRPLPISVENTVTIMHVLDGTEDEDLCSFGEGDERTPLDVFQDLLKKLPKRVEFGEVSESDDEVAFGELDKDGIANEIRRVQSEVEAQGGYISSADALKQIRGH